MLYGKHPTLGNAHFPDEQRTAREAAGWVIWPRTRAQKNAAPKPSVDPQIQEPGSDLPKPQARRGVTR